MSAASGRKWEIWTSNMLSELTDISGDFHIQLTPLTMVDQSLELLSEIAVSVDDYKNANPSILPFLKGMQSSKGIKEKRQSELFFRYTFATGAELQNFKLEELIERIGNLELSLDTVFNVESITFVADFGSAHRPLWQAQQIRFGSGVGFEVEERMKVTDTFRKLKDKNIEEHRVALNYYKTGMLNLLLGDQFSGLIDSAFMQFYLCIESILGTHEGNAAANRALSKSITPKIDELVRHVFLARHQFYGHANPKNKVIHEARTNEATAFEIQKQVLVAKWVARDLLASITDLPLSNREMRLYPNPTTSYSFTGNVEELKDIFALPRKVKS